MNSPYENAPIEVWPKITAELINDHPLKEKEAIQIILEAWDCIFECKIDKYKIGEQIFPKPQIMGFLLHEIIALKLQEKYPKVWRCEHKSQDKDVVCLLDDLYSIEIKTSSSDKHIYGNRSYAQKSKVSKKSKSGYYLAINFEKFDETDRRPQISCIRFGWLDHEDWQGQIASTGQQARLSTEVENYKLKTLYANDR